MDAAVQLVDKERATPPSSYPAGFEKALNVTYNENYGVSRPHFCLLLMKQHM